MDLWRRCDAPTPARANRYSPRDQLRRERRKERFLEMLDAEVRSLPDARQYADQKLDRITDAFSRHAAPVLDLTGEHVDLLRNEFVPFASEFSHAARCFDAAISAPDIYQASRNAWTVTAYSLLYPYTDNYLDDPTVGQTSKQAFNRRLRLWLNGESNRPRPRMRPRCTTWSA
jgi:hypothetical protein